MKEKFSVLTLGCPKNVVDSENMIALLEKNDFEYSENPQDAGAVIINTCGFINSAKEESVRTILETANSKRHSNMKVIVAGCLSQRYKEELREQIPEVDAFFGVNDFRAIAKYLKRDELLSLEGERRLLTPPHYAYVKIAEGCDRLCSFCAIPSIRGGLVSRTIENIEDEVRMLKERDVRELILIAQDTTRYGKDIYGEARLPELVERVSDIFADGWIRVMYAYPANFPFELLKILSERENVCKYIDIPFQHISDKILKSMRRGSSGAYIKNLIEKIHETNADIAVRSAFIVGYPGESEAEFIELLDFIKEYKLDRLGVFQYSQEENTPAYSLGDPVEDEEKQRRFDALMAAQQEISLEKNRAKTGEKSKILIDEFDGENYVGRTEFDAPEIDCAAIVESESPLAIGDFVDAEVVAAAEYDLFCKAAT